MPQPLSAQRAAQVARAQSFERTAPSVSSIPRPANTGINSAWTTRRKDPASVPDIPTRRYDIMWLADNGDIMDQRERAPALPIFEAAFNAFGRGALIQTDQGHVAVEDLLPGDRVETVDGDYLPVTWIGAMDLDNDGRRAPNAGPEKLYRLTADALGLGQPAPDLMLGANARYLLRAESLKSYLGTAHALAPVAAMADGVSISEITPISTVRSYHICLPQHRLIRANGVELESFHPGIAASSQLQGALRDRFMALFPHLNQLGDFGAMAHPRLTPTDLIEIGLL